MGAHALRPAVNVRTWSLLPDSSAPVVAADATSHARQTWKLPSHNELSDQLSGVLVQPGEEALDRFVTSR